MTAANAGNPQLPYVALTLPADMGGATHLASTADLPAPGDDTVAQIAVTYCGMSLPLPRCTEGSNGNPCIECLVAAGEQMPAAVSWLG